MSSYNMAQSYNMISICNRLINNSVNEMSVKKEACMGKEHAVLHKLGLETYAGFCLVQVT